MFDSTQGVPLSFTPAKIGELLPTERVLCQHESRSKKSVLTTIVELFHQSLNHLETTPLFDAYIARERLGSTALGRGIAIPHIRVESVNQPMMALLQLKQGIDFGAEDKQPVDIIVALLVPDHHAKEHLNLLAELAQSLSQSSVRRQLREAKTVKQLHQRFINSHVHKQALSA